MTQEEMEHWFERLSHVSDRMGEAIALQKEVLARHDAMLVAQARPLQRIETMVQTILGHVQNHGPNGQERAPHA